MGRSLMDDELEEKEDTMQEKITKLREQPIMFPMDDITEHIPPTSDEFQYLSLKQEKLVWHNKLGHAPFSNINILA
jgi:hypothetical protein